MRFDKLHCVSLPTAGYKTYDYDNFWEAIKVRGVVATIASQVFADPCV